MGRSCLGNAGVRLSGSLGSEALDPDAPGHVGPAKTAPQRSDDTLAQKPKIAALADGRSCSPAHKLPN
jgi:hypothetical protein